MKIPFTGVKRTVYHDSKERPQEKPVRYDVLHANHDYEPWYSSRVRYDQLAVELELWRQEKAEKARRYKESGKVAFWVSIAIGSVLVYYLLKHWLKF